MWDGLSATVEKPRVGRLRKAWAVRVSWMSSRDPSDIVFAPTAGKARAQVVYRLQDCGYEGNLWPKVAVRRAAEADVHLPPLHPVAESLTEEHRDIVVHAYGGRGMKAGYRNHFATHPGDMDLLRLAWEDGLFSGPHTWPGSGPTALDGTPDTVFFLLTNRGREVAASMVETYPDV